MELDEPRSARRALSTVLIAFSFLGLGAPAMAENWSGFEISNFANFDVLKNSPDKFHSYVDQAKQVLAKDRRFADSAAVGQIRFDTDRAVADRYTTTLKFAQTYKGVEVVGEQALFHYGKDGALRSVTGEARSLAVDVEPKLSVEEALKILSSRKNGDVRLSEAAKLKILKDRKGGDRLVYYLKTKTTAVQVGTESYVDAHDGTVVVETPRIYHALRRTVLSADTEEARQYVDPRNGGPMAVNLAWYEKVLEDGDRLGRVDRSALKAYQNAGRVYDYYRRTFKRHSFDDHDARLVSVVHMGDGMNNAFWDDEKQIMAYGDGDGEHLTDLTYALDVAGHEITHGVTTNTANLIYQGESGALNESYSDFFGKMIDYSEGDWYIGRRIIGPKLKPKRKALRNMIDPEEFDQPGSLKSKLVVDVNQECTPENDLCGVHVNSGIPNRAAALLVEDIGKEKTEDLYYNVLTQRLRQRSDFADARRQTEEVCAEMFGENSSECRAVEKAFRKVGL